MNWSSFGLMYIFKRYFIGHGLGLVLVLVLSSCRLFDPLVNIHPAEDAQLHGGYDQTHILNLRVVDPSAGILAFELCLKDANGEQILQSSCINPYFVVKLDQNGQFNQAAPKIPLLMNVAAVDLQQFSADEIEYLTSRQSQIVDYLKSRNHVARSTGFGVAGMTIGGAQLSNALLNSSGANSVPVVRLALSILLLAGSTVSLMTANHQATEVNEIKDRLLSDQTPSVLSDKPASWMVVFENFEKLMSIEESDDAVPLDSIEDIIPRLGIVLHFQKFIQSGYQLVESCIPQFSADQLTEFVTACESIF